MLAILALFRSHDGQTDMAPLCEVCAQVVAVTGAGIMLMSNDLPQGSVCSSNATSVRLEELQFTMGEGPCVDAYAHDRPVLEPDLADPATLRWPAFAPAAVDAGARAVFGFPMQVGAVRVGALNLYRDEPGTLSDDQHADALAMAEVAARQVLAMQANAPAGEIAAEMETGGNLRLVVHQASGMVAAQLEVSVAEALIRLRARAFAEQRPLTDLATDVVERRLRFTPTSPGTHPG